MKRFLIWYLPQAALFCWGFWMAATSKAPDARPGLALLAGVVAAGVYTALVIIVRDAPANWRGLSRKWRRITVAIGVGLVGGFAALLARLGQPPQGVVFLLPFLGLLWLLILAFTNDLTARLKRHDSQPSGDSLGLIGARGSRSKATKHVDRARIGK